MKTSTHRSTTEHRLATIAAGCAVLCAWGPHRALAQATDYFVSTSGSDANAGTESQPWRTITHAASALSLGASGTTVHVAPGTYGECVFTNRSGTAERRIRYVSDVPLGARIRCDASSNPASSSTVWANGTGSSARTGDYVDIVGFDISATTPTERCEGISQFGAFGLIEHNYVHDILGQNATTCHTAGGGGIVLRNNGNPPTVAHDTIVNANIVDNIGRGDDDVIGHVCITLHGIYIASPRQTLTNNIISRACGWGVHMYHDTYEDVVSNNIVINNYRGGIIVSASDGFTNDRTSVINNIVAHNGGGEYAIEERWGSSGPNNVYRNNLFWENAPTTGCSNPPTGVSDCPYNFTNGARTATGTLFASSDDAVFLRYDGSGAAGDYHPTPGSTAVGAGVDGPCATGGLSPCVPSTDFDGVTRSATLSVGAFELAPEMGEDAGVPDASAPGSDSGTGDGERASDGGPGDGDAGSGCGTPACPEDPADASAPRTEHDDGGGASMADPGGISGTCSCSAPGRTGPGLPGALASLALVALLRLARRGARGPRTGARRRGRRR